MLESITKSGSDKELFKLLSDELSRLVDVDPIEDLDGWVKTVKTLPIGLRAMAATHGLDVSMTLDDLGWHFGNWPSMELARETHAGLGELGCHEEQRVFGQAFEIAQRNWDFINTDDFWDRYLESEMKTAMMPLNEKLWRLLGLGGHKDGISLLDRWARYARRHPERVLKNP